MTAATYGRQARHLARSLAGAWSGKERGPDRGIRRNSFDVADRRAQVFRPIGDGTERGALLWIDCMLRTIAEWDNAERKKGGERPLGLYGLRVLEVLLGRHRGIPIDFKTGRLEPAIDTIARVAHMSRTTVVRALARLRELKLLGWVRRTQRAETAGGYGPQRQQVTNAYWFDASQLPARVLQRFRDLVARRKLRQAGVAPPPAPPPPQPSAELAAALARVDRALAAREVNASPPSGQYPSSGVKG